MLNRLLTMLFIVVAIAGFAGTSQAQYMFLDSDNDGLPGAGDVMQANGVATTVKAYLYTNRDRLGTTRTCVDGQDPSPGIDVFAYAVNLQANGGTVDYGAWVSAAHFATNFASQDPNNGTTAYISFANGSGVGLAEGGPHLLFTIPVTGQTGSPRLDIVISSGLVAADPTYFGTHCFGDFTGSQLWFLTTDLNNFDGEWTDVDGVAPAAGAVNTPPVLAAIGNRTVNEGSLLSFTATATDADTPAQTLTFSLTLGSPAATGASITAAGAFTWTPTEAQGPGVYPITITVTDDGAPPANDSEAINVTVNEVNQAPILAAIGNRTVNEGSLLSFTATATDADLPANTLTFSLTLGTPAATGASITTGGAFTWTPTEAQGPGVYPITVNVSDGTATDNELISVTVNEVNVAPILAAIGNQTVNEGSLLSFTATATDADVPAQTLTFSLTLGSPAATGASITTGGAFTWTPTEAQGPGVYPITIAVSDGALSDNELINVTVNEVNVAPILAAIGNRTVNESSLLSFTATATDADLPAQTLTFSLTLGSPAATGASITTGGAFTWTPTEAQGPGVYPITIAVSDGSLSDNELINVTVNEVNVAPILAAIGNRTVNEGSLLSFTATATDADLPANTLTFSLTLGSPAATGASITTGGAFTWTPTEAQGPGVYPITIAVSDGALSDNELINVTVNEVNVAPILAAIGNRTVNEGSLLSFTATATDADLPANTLTFSLTLGSPAATGASITTGGAFTWTPTEAQGPGVYPITIAVSDGALSDNELINVTVNEVNVAPILAAIGNRTVNEGSLLSFTATATDADLPAQTLTWSLTLGTPAATGASINGGGAFTWTPTEAQGPGVYPITVNVSDGSLTDNELINVTVNEVNVAPVLAAIGNRTATEGALLSFTATATDADLPANTLTFSLTLGTPAATGASITTGGAFTWTPTGTQGGSVYPITINVSDGALSDNELIQVTVNEGANTPPVLAAIGNRTVNEGSLLSFTATATDADLPANTLTFSLTLGSPAATGASITGGGAFTWTPTEAQGPGVYPITIAVSDGSASDTELINVTVNEVNVAPILAAIGNRTVNEGSLLSFTATATDADLPANTLTFSLTLGSPAATGASITTGGAFTWTPTEAQGGSVYPITIAVSDGALSDNELINVTVTDTNQAPILAAIGNRTVNEGSLLSFTATATDADLPANTLTFSLTLGSPAATGASITTGGAFTWTPTEAQGPGVYPITITVTDNGTPVLNDTELINVTVNEVNVAPILAAIGNRTVNEGSLLSFTATATDADLPANTLTFSLTLGSPAATGASITTGGAFTWTPTEAQGGSVYPITIAVSDGALSDNELINVTVTDTNQAPVLAAIGDRAATVGVQLAFTATATDADIPAQTLTFTLGAAPAGAAITAGGNFTWTPAATGTFPTTIIVTDNGTPNLNDSETFNIIVGGNVPPVLAAIGNRTVNEGSLLSFTATATDADVPAQTLTFSLTLGSPAATGASITTGGAFTWTPTEAQGPGVYPITITVTDNGAPPANDSELINVTVNEVNVAPILAAIGNRTVNEGSLLSFTATATDADLPANTLTFSLTLGSPAATGASITTGGAFTWTPTEAQGPGVYPITIAVSDGSLSDNELINVTVNEVNVAPILAAIGNRTVNEGSLLSFTATATDADLPANTLTFSLTLGSPAATGASITTGGAFTWTPTEAQGPGVYPITIAVSDGALSDNELINVTVNEVNVAPILAAIGNRTVNEGSLLSFTATATDADLPANTLTFSLTLGSPAATGASITTGGAFTWTPTEAQGPGVYPITIAVSDGALSDNELINVTVNEVNVAPILAAIGNRTVNEGSLLSFTATATDADLPANTLTFSLTLGSPAATGASITTGGAFTWTPTEAQGGSVYPITIAVSDGALSDNELINVTVTDTNQAPVLAAIGNRTVNEGSLLSFTATATDADLPAQTLTFSLTLGTPAATGASITTGGAFTWTPTGTQGGSVYPITINVSDGALSDNELIQVTVNEGANTPPILAAIGNRTVNEGSLLSFTATATDADIPAQTLTFSLTLGSPAATGASITTGGAFTWTPTEAQGPGVYPITIAVSDGSASDTELINVTVNEVNVAPILAAIGNRTVNEGSLLSFTATATDADLPANTLTFSLTLGSPAATGASITTGGAFTWTPTEAQGGSVYPITIAVSDGALSDNELINVTVTDTNQAPILAAIGNRTVNEGSLLSFTATATDADLPANTLTFSLTLGSPAATGASITTGGAFTWTPTEAQGPGVYPITIAVSDGSLSDNELINVTVNEVNVAPILAAIGNRTVNEGSLLSFTATATDADLPANTLTFSLTLGSPAATGASITTGGAFTWTPTEAQGPGVYPITIAVSDGSLSDNELIQVTVNEVNTAPVLAPIGNQSAATLSLLTFTATATDADIPANSLTFTLDAGAPTGAAITTAGVFTWTPTGAQVGAFPVTVRVTDNGTPTLDDFETITINVSDTNLAPVLNAIGNKTVNEGSLLSFTATATDANAGQTLTFSLDAGAPTGAAITAAGAFTWTPTEAQGPNVYPVTVRVTDNGVPVLDDFEAISITVTEVNAAPVLAAIGNKTVNEGSLLSFTATATDADVPPQALTFSLTLGSPAATGASITAAGAFTWTPTEAQGPGVYPITIAVSDGSLSDNELISVTVNEVNAAPVLAAIGNKTVNENALLSFTATATDADIPANTMGFTLDAGFPAGAGITAAGAFTWTPTSAQIGVHPITVRVTDNGTPVLDDSETIQVTVQNVNEAPVMTQPTDMMVDEGQSDTQQLAATDPDSDPLTFNKVNTSPTFMTVSASGLVTLTPNFTESGNYTGTVRVSDGSLADTESFAITVNDVNQPPVAEANGPYFGTISAAIQFSSAGSNDPDGGGVDYLWDFGDATSSMSANPTHLYAAASPVGGYIVTLTVTETGGGLSAMDNTTATVVDFLEARIFFAGGNKTTRLGSGKPTTCAQLEPINGSFNLNDVDLTAITMTYGGSSITAGGSKTVVDGDKDGNGIMEVAACWSKDDLRILFASLGPGSHEVEVEIRAPLISGGEISGMAMHTVIGTGGALEASVSPNPLNPSAVVTFRTDKDGPVQVKLFDVQGRLVRTLADESFSPAGYHDVMIDGMNDRGQRLSSGMYFLFIETASGTERTKVSILK